MIKLVVLGRIDPYIIAPDLKKKTSFLFPFEDLNIDVQYFM